jgi:hypothetical protein
MTQLKAKVGAGVLNKSITNGTLRRDIQQAVSDWINKKHVVLFLDWDLTQKKSKQAAIESLTDIVMSVLEQLQENINRGKQLPPPPPDAKSVAWQQPQLPSELLPREKEVKE